MVKSENEKKDSMGFALNSTLGAVIGLILTMGLLMIFAALIYSGKIGEQYSQIVIICSSFLGICLGGLISAKRQKKNYLPSAVAAGGIYFVLILLLTALGGEGTAYGVMSIKMGICSICGSMLGGVLAANKPKKTKSKRTRR